MLLFGTSNKRKDFILAWLGIFGLVLTVYSYVLWDKLQDHIENKKVISFLITKPFLTAGNYFQIFIQNFFAIKHLSF